MVLEWAIIKDELVKHFRVKMDQTSILILQKTGRPEQEYVSSTHKEKKSKRD